LLDIIVESQQDRVAHSTAQKIDKMLVSCYSCRNVLVSPRETPYSAVIRGNKLSQLHFFN